MAFLHGISCILTLVQCRFRHVITSLILSSKTIDLHLSVYFRAEVTQVA